MAKESYICPKRDECPYANINCQHRLPHQRAGRNCAYSGQKCPQCVEWHIVIVKNERPLDG